MTTTTAQSSFNTSFDINTHQSSTNDFFDNQNVKVEHQNSEIINAFLHSAYLQSLAETCYIILNDQRWRDPSDISNRPLMRWEHGDDLSIILWLARRFDPTASFISNDISSFSVTNCEIPSPYQYQQQAHSNQQRNKYLESEISDRSLYLFCRLFFRKGPWFRLDDLFWKYYVKKYTQSSSQNPLRRCAVGREEIYDVKFKTINLDESLMEQQCQRLEQLLDDIKCLYKKGVIRSFQNEDECGKVCDATTLLTKEERAAVLFKLGVRKPTWRSNEISKQMRTQRPIFSFHSTPGDGMLLPVAKHVHKVVRTRLFKEIILSCTSSPNLSSTVMEQRIGRLEQRFSYDNPFFCLCLRYRPTMTLRRCVRLFSCATAGPGSMRGHVNGWTSLQVLELGDSPPPLSSLLPPPGVQCFHQVTHPGLATCFGLRQAMFRHAYVHHAAIMSTLPSSLNHDMNSTPPACVFPTRGHFIAWEMTVELRAQVDYLLQLSESLRSYDRRKIRGLTPLGSGTKPNQCLCQGSVDFLSILAGNRYEIVRKLLPEASNDQLNELLESIEANVKQCFHVEYGEKPLIESEMVLIVIALLGANTLALRIRTVNSFECDSLSRRTWLRHLTWESVMAYALWDILPILERREMYHTAIFLLEILLFGTALNHENVVCTDTGTTINLPMLPKTIQDYPLGSILLSRRARGKAYDRFIIDYNHLITQHQKSQSITGNATLKTRRTDVLRFCEAVLSVALISSHISFSSIRGLARRLKRPLEQLICTQYCIEAAELGLRCTIAVENESIKTSTATRYSDWSPIMDTALANPLRNHDAPNKSFVGRCAFVGFEDEEVSDGSLNVEQLAMEYYRTGRFKVGDGPVQGGWRGWHDEGSHIRALFRILCAPVLGMNRACNGGAKDLHLVHVTPYQQAPFDLHVGFSVARYFQNEEQSICSGFYFNRRATIDSFLEEISNMTPQQLCDAVFDSILSAKQNERIRIVRGNQDVNRVRTLSLIAAGCGGPLLAAAFRCLFFDYRHYCGGLPDLLLVRAIESNLIGNIIPTDYVSGTGTNASVPLSSNIAGNNTFPFLHKEKLLDLEHWIGEDTVAFNSGTTIAFDEDEFLGCSKVEGTANSRSLGTACGRTKQSSMENENYTTLSGNDLPNDLIDEVCNGISDSRTEKLSENNIVLPKRLFLGTSTRVECLMVEVKSSNDRLDARQADWLNILDQFGNCRVCKFTTEPQAPMEPSAAT